VLMLSGRWRGARPQQEQQHYHQKEYEHLLQIKDYFSGQLRRKTWQTSPTAVPTVRPTLDPTKKPSLRPTPKPGDPTCTPTVRPTRLPTPGLFVLAQWLYQLCFFYAKLLSIRTQ